MEKFIVNELEKLSLKDGDVLLCEGGNKEVLRRINGIIKYLRDHLNITVHVLTIPEGISLHNLSELELAEMGLSKDLKAKINSKIIREYVSRINTVNPGTNKKYKTMELIEELRLKYRPEVTSDRIKQIIYRHIGGIN